MTNQTRTLKTEARALAQEIIDDHSETDADGDTYLDTDAASDAVHEWADSHEWVIHPYHSRRLVNDADAPEIDSAWEEMAGIGGMESAESYDHLCGLLAYFLLSAAIRAEIKELAGEYV